MTVLTDELFEAAVRAEVAANPDHKYQPPGKPGARCLYVHEGKGSCLIGRALIRAGVSVEIVASLDDGVGDSEYTCADEVLPTLGVSERLASWAGFVQSQQDIGTPDGEALVYADEGRANDPH